MSDEIGSDSETRTKRQLVAHKMRQAIIRGEFLPGAPLRQGDLTVQYKVSLIPVREALRQLHGDGFIKILPHKEIIVAPISDAEARELAELLMSLEQIALRAAWPKLKPEDLDEADELFKKIDWSGDIVRASEISWLAREKLFVPGGRPLLLQFVSHAFQLSLRYFHLIAGKIPKTGPRPSYREVIARCRDKDLSGAQAAIERYYSGLIESFLPTIAGTTRAGRR